MTHSFIAHGIRNTATRTAHFPWGAILLVAVLSGTPCATRADDFFIHDGDRVVFLGDSITQQMFYTNYIEAYTLSRHPTWKLTFRNVGWGGDTSWLRQRSRVNEAQLFAANDDDQIKMVTGPIRKGLDRDVLPLHPTVVTIDFGMNDFGYQSFRPDILRAYIHSETLLARYLADAGARPVFLTTQPIEEKAADPDQDVRNLSLRKFADALRDLAVAENVPFADQFAPYMQAMLRSHQATIGGGGDSVHPGPPGHTVMAWAVLKALGAMPLVSTAVVDAKGVAVGETHACRVSNLKADAGGVSFDRLDDALPMPVDPKAEPIMDLIPLTHDLNQFELTVLGLPPGKYDVTIDGETADTVSADTLAQGWNLAYKAGPITRQSNELLVLVERKNALYFERWRNVQLFYIPDWAAKGSDFESRRKAELDRLDAEIGEIEGKINSTRAPKPRHFVVTPSNASE